MVNVYFGIHMKCTKSTCFLSENTVKTHEHSSKTVASCIIYGRCVFLYTCEMYKSTCFCSENTVKTHENTYNTSKTVNFMYNIWYMCNLVYMLNVPKVHFSAVKTKWKPMKTLAKLCISCIIYGICVFWYTCEMYQNYMFLQ
jgi:hypothetical protein